MKSFHPKKAVTFATIKKSRKMENRKYNSRRFVLVFAALLSAFGPFMTDLYLPAFPELMEYFDTTTSLIQLSLTFGVIGLAAGQLVIGPLSDKYGRRRPLILSLTVFVVSTLICLLCRDVITFICFRLLQGIAAAGGVVISRSIAVDLYEGKEFTRFFAMLSAVQGLAPIVAPIAGGLLLGITDWRGIFMTDAVRTLKEWTDAARKIVFFGGAGVSTESGIPDFRSTGGLYHQEWKYPPETILSHTFYKSNPEEFFRFYRAKMLCPDAKPNAAHKKLAEWEREGKLLAVVTQNIDGLHQAAGSKQVYELHGSVHRNYCEKCGKFYDLDHILHTTGVPRCDCGGVIKPDVVLYEEALNDRVIDGAVNAIAQADLLIVGGTSLNVWPAAGLINYFRGDRLALINKSPVARDLAAGLVITDPIGEVLSQL